MLWVVDLVCHFTTTSTSSFWLQNVVSGWSCLSCHHHIHIIILTTECCEWLILSVMSPPHPHHHFDYRMLWVVDLVCCVASTISALTTQSYCKAHHFQLSKYGRHQWDTPCPSKELLMLVLSLFCGLDFSVNFTSLSFQIVLYIRQSWLASLRLKKAQKTSFYIINNKKF